MTIKTWCGSTVELADYVWYVRPIVLGRVAAGHLRAWWAR